jgi:hypothetical protein
VSVSIISFIAACAREKTIVIEMMHCKLAASACVSLYYYFNYGVVVGEASFERARLCAKICEEFAQQELFFNVTGKCGEQREFHQQQQKSFHCHSMSQQ